MTDADQEQQQSEPPNAVEAEQAVLAAVLIEPAVLPKLAARLRVEDFYSQRHKRIYEQALALLEAGTPVDHVSLRSALKEQGRLEMIGGNYLSELLLADTSVSTVDYHAQIIIEKKARREAIKLAHKALKEAYDGEDVSGFLSNLSQSAAEIAQRATGARRVTMLSDVVADVIDGVILRAANPDVMPGIATGLPAFDDILGGWQPGTINIVAARPGMGKTQFGIAAAHYAAAVLGKRVNYHSLEMPKAAITRRWLAQVSGFDQSALKFGRMGGQHNRLWDYIELGGAANRVAITDCTDEVDTVDKLRAAAKRIEESGGDAELNVIDHVGHLHEGEIDNRDIELMRIFTKLRNWATKENKSLLIFSQLNRACEARQDKRPAMADLRSSGEIEQHADSVTVLYRDEYYNPETPARGECELIVRKQRDGQIGTAVVAFDAATGRFYPLDKDYKSLAQQPQAGTKGSKTRYGTSGRPVRGSYGNNDD